MKKYLSFLFVLIVIIALTACNTEKAPIEGTKDQETVIPTEKATEKAVETEPNTEPETVPSADPMPTISESTYEADWVDLPYISNHTAVELINYSVPELVALMGNDFDLEYSGDRLVYYTAGGLCFYNDETLPGFAFFINEAERDINHTLEDGKPDEESYAVIKDNILSGKYKDFDFMCVYGGAKYNDEIKSDMRYKEISEILGSYELSPIIASNDMKQSIALEPPASIYYEPVLDKLSRERGKTEDTKEYTYYNIEEAKMYNPYVDRIAVFKSA